MEAGGLNLDLDLFSEASRFSTRLVLAIKHLQSKDKHALSNLNILLKDYHSSQEPRETDADMVRLELLYLRRQEQGSVSGEGQDACLHLQLLPLKLNLDQDMVNFLIQFVQSVSVSQKNDDPAKEPVEQHQDESKATPEAFTFWRLAVIERICIHVDYHVRAVLSVISL